MCFYGCCISFCQVLKVIVLVVSWCFHLFCWQFNLSHCFVILILSSSSGSTSASSTSKQTASNDTHSVASKASKASSVMKVVCVYLCICSSLILLNWEKVSETLCIAQNSSYLASYQLLLQTISVSAPQTAPPQVPPRARRPPQGPQGLDGRDKERWPGGRWRAVRGAVCGDCELWVSFFGLYGHGLFFTLNVVSALWASKVLLVFGLEVIFGVQNMF